MALSGCADHRLAATEYPRVASQAVPTTDSTALSQALAPMERAHPGMSGFMLIPNGRDAFLMRIAMIEAAQESVDLQYYSISNDKTGQLLLEALLKAADRGVRVRVLVDELNIKGADQTLALLSEQPHIEVRVFNPLATEDDSLVTRVADVTVDLGHFLRRMHNKAFIVDNQLAVAGGRNLGDEYFGFSDEFNFHDLDILAAGPVAAAISGSFDRYWNGTEAYPINLMETPSHAADKIAALRADLQAHWQSEKEAGELRQLIPLADQLGKHNVQLKWAKATLAADDPAKIDTPEDQAQSRPEARIDKLADVSRREFIIVSPYFVPGDDGAAWLESMARDGVKVRILTNSLASTDVVAVHAGYRPYRKGLLAGGVELYELKPLAGAPRSSRGFRSGSRASLHTKVYVIDRKDLVIGSFNFDQRSQHLNTELALVIHSPELAGQVAQLFEHITAPATSYRVTLDGGRLLWTGEENGALVTGDDDPQASLWRRIKANMISLLPIDSQL